MVRFYHVVMWVVSLAIFISATAGPFSYATLWLSAIALLIWTAILILDHFGEL